MNEGLIIDNLLDPTILFFFLGMIAVWIKSDLEIPQPLPRLFSLYLLLAIGFKGGVELAHTGIDLTILKTLLVAVISSIVIPIYLFFFLKRRLDISNAGAIAATYGSVSAVTFVTAVSFLDNLGISYGGHMVAALALMESPSIIVGVFLVRRFDTSKPTSSKRLGINDTLREAFTNGSVVMILGSLLIGLLSGEKGAVALSPFTNDIFKGMLCLFLLDMGILAATRVRALRNAGPFLILFALTVPIIHGVLSVFLTAALDISAGNALLLAVLISSGSYIAVPAAYRLAVPEANPGLYVPMSLAITFPFNIILGIPLYFYLINQFH
ncbi:MAG: sodium-dependent bicarbonate transport family permease [Bacteroidota bacterium]